MAFAEFWFCITLVMLDLFVIESKIADFMSVNLILKLVNVNRYQ